MLPTRAYRYCEPATTASGYGYYIFPAMDFFSSFRWLRCAVDLAGRHEWQPIPKSGHVQYPGFGDYFASVAPSECADYAPPLLGVLELPGYMQVWSASLPAPRQGWSLLVRSPVNFGRPGGFETFEGIIETDRWFGPAVPISVCSDGRPIEFVRSIRCCTVRRTNDPFR